MIARCANLPVEIQNGNGLGGGRIVGWLPIVCFNIYCFLFFLSQNILKVEEDAAESGKLNYVSFKRVVWHESFRKLLASIHRLSKEGYWVPCADGQVRRIFPSILILSADYEEQYDQLYMF